MLNIFSYLHGLRQFAASCVDYQPSFFGFPTWYKYLYEKGKIAPDCSIVTTGADPFVFSDIWLIGYAIIDMAIYAAGIIAVFMIIWGGFRFITSQGSPESIKSARETILYAVIGLIVSISARVIMNLVDGIFL